MKRGQILARLDTSRLEPQVAEAEATAAAQREVVVRMHNGSRPQEIAEARANVASAEADAVNARGQYERLKTLAANEVVSREDLDNAKAALDEAEAKLDVNQKALELAVAGPRQEDIAQAEAELRADEAQAAFLRARARRRDTDSPHRSYRSHAPDGARRDGVAAKAGVLARGD